jgi:preprotein translocase subunit SecG
MSSLLTFVVVIQVLSALTIIGLVLMQHGKGADMGAAFGSGASGSLFGATGSSNFLSKSTGVAAVVFFGATLALAFMGSRTTVEDSGVMGSLPAVTVPTPASSAPAEIPGSTSTEQNNAGPSTAAPGNNVGQANQIPK